MIIINQENGKRANVKTFVTGGIYGRGLGMTPENYAKLLKKLNVTEEDFFTLTDGKGKEIFIRNEFYGSNLIIGYY